MIEALRSGQIGHAGLDVFADRAAAAGSSADAARQRNAVGPFRLPHAGGERKSDRGGVAALPADRRLTWEVSSPDEAQRNPLRRRTGRPRIFAALHPGYGGCYSGVALRASRNDDA